MRIAANRELQRAESPLAGSGALLVVAEPLTILVLKAGFDGEREVASHIQSYFFPALRPVKENENASAPALASNLWTLNLAAASADWRSTIAAALGAAAAVVVVVVLASVVVAVLVASVLVASVLVASVLVASVLAAVVVVVVVVA